MGLVWFYLLSLLILWIGGEMQEYLESGDHVCNVNMGV